MFGRRRQDEQGTARRAGSSGRRACVVALFELRYADALRRRPLRLPWVRRGSAARRTRRGVLGSGGRGRDVIEDRECKRCGFPQAELRQTISAGGQVQVGWVCRSCASPVMDRRGRQYIPHDELRAAGIEPADLPIQHNYSRDTRCIHCGTRGAQVHHWAPRAIFGSDADLWPTDMLCQPCHDEWHARLTGKLTSKLDGLTGKAPYVYGAGKSSGKDR